MAESPTWLIKRCAEFEPLKNIRLIPARCRGVYVLLNHRPKRGEYEVVYVGMARRGAAARLRSHARSKKGPRWTHFSLFEVHDNITAEMIAELEGLLRHIYRKDARANELNVQGTHRPIRLVKAKLAEWDAWKWGQWEWYWG